MRRLMILFLAVWIVETVGCDLHAAIRSNVRLNARVNVRDPLSIRRLHLMRPDLIFFPLDWRVYA